jgi:hypothetical protein
MFTGPTGTSSTVLVQVFVFHVATFFGTNDTDSNERRKKDSRFIYVQLAFITLRYIKLLFLRPSALPHRHVYINLEQHTIPVNKKSSHESLFHCSRNTGI